MPVRSRRTLFVTAMLLATGCAAFGQESGNAVENVQVRATAHFTSGRTVVLPHDQQHLLAEVATMKDVTWQKVTTEGHTDSVGSAAYNQALSIRRGEAVRAFLVGKGLDPAMIQATGAGPSHPVASNGTAGGRARNRRTEVTFEGVRTVASAH